MAKYIPLRIDHKKYKAIRNNVFAIVDDQDYQMLLDMGNWRLSNAGYAEIVVNRKDKNCSILMHRVLMEAKKGHNIDHIDGNPLNNQKSNLRYATTAQNSWNRKGVQNSTSKYKGVSWAKQFNKWYACIKKNGKSKNLGYYASEIEAAKVYDKEAKSLFGDYARLNINL